MELHPESDKHTENSGDDDGQEHSALVDIGKLSDFKRLQLMRHLLRTVISVEKADGECRQVPCTEAVRPQDCV